MTADINSKKPVTKLTIGPITMKYLNNVAILPYGFQKKQSLYGMANSNAKCNTVYGIVAK
jgi:hypothetical protein